MCLFLISLLLFFIIMSWYKFLNPLSDIDARWRTFFSCQKRALTPEGAHRFFCDWLKEFSQKLVIRGFSGRWIRNGGYEILKRREFFFFIHAITILSLFTYFVGDEKVKIYLIRMKIGTLRFSKLLITNFHSKFRNPVGVLC